MAVPAGETASALYGAYRLARLDPGGMKYFRNTPGAFWRSFRAALLIAPFYGILLIVRYATGEISAPPLTFITVETIAYAVAWLAFPVAAEPLARAFGRGDRYIRFIVAYNWAAVLQNLLYMPLAMLSITAVLPAGSGGFLGLAVLIIIMVYIWFIARTALEISGPQAAVIVAMDFTISMLINGYSEMLL